MGVFDTILFVYLLIVRKYEHLSSARGESITGKTTSRGSTTAHATDQDLLLPTPIHSIDLASLASNGIQFPQLVPLEFSSLPASSQHLTPRLRFCTEGTVGLLFEYVRVAISILPRKEQARPHNQS